jgi:hypothetical protein
LIFVHKASRAVWHHGKKENKNKFEKRESFSDFWCLIE